MGRAPCCDKANVKRGPWSPEEDAALKAYMERNAGTVANWIALPPKAGLRRCGKSCRLRWLNYLRPDIKHGFFTQEEDDVIFTLYNTIGSRWSVIASHLPGRTDNDVKNYWNTKLKKKMKQLQQQQTPTSLNNPSPPHLFPPPTPTPTLKTSQANFSSTAAAAVDILDQSSYNNIPFPALMHYSTAAANTMMMMMMSPAAGLVVSPPPAEEGSSSTSTVDNNWSANYNVGAADLLFFPEFSDLLGTTGGFINGEAAQGPIYHNVTYS